MTAYVPGTEGAASILVPLTAVSAANNDANIQAALNAAQTIGYGATVQLFAAAPGPLPIIAPGAAGYTVYSGTRVTWLGGPWRPIGGGMPTLPESVMQVQNTPSNGAVFAGPAWIGGTANSDYGIEMDHIPIDMNAISAHGIALAGRNTRIHDCEIYNWQGAFSALVIGQRVAAAGVTLQENRIWNNTFKIVGGLTGATAGQHAVYISHVTSASRVTDSWIGPENLLAGIGDSAVRCDTGANNNTILNHIYNGVGLTPDISYGDSSGSQIFGNDFDVVSKPGTAASTQTVIQIDAIDSSGIGSGTFFQPTRIYENRMHGNEANGSGASNWQYIAIEATSGSSAADTAYLELHDNVIQQDQAGSGTSSAYFVATGGAANPGISVRWNQGTCIGAFASNIVKATDGGTYAFLRTDAQITNGAAFLTANSGTLSAGSANELTAAVTANLHPGVWLITGQAIVSGASSAGEIDVYVAPASSGGATLAAPFASGFGATMHMLATGNGEGRSFQAVVTVTATGKLDLWVAVPSGMTGTVIANTGGQSGVTGVGTVRMTGITWTQLA